MLRLAIRILVGCAGLALAAGGLIAAIERDGRPDAIAGAALSLAAGLLLALAVGAWRRSWQRHRPHREAWGRAAWVCVWLAAGAIGLVVMVWDAVLLLPLALASCLVALVGLPGPSRITARPRFGDDWAPVEAAGGRVQHDGVTVVLPEGWTAWRIPATADQAAAIAFVPQERRWDLPIPIIGLGRLTGEAGPAGIRAEALIDHIRAGLGRDHPVEITHLRSGSAFIAGETALSVDIDARLRRNSVPIPGPLMAVGQAVLGIRPVAGRLYLVDRVGERWAMGWLGWADGRERLRGIGEAVVETLRWPGA